MNTIVSRIINHEGLFGPFIMSLNPLFVTVLERAVARDGILILGTK